MVVVPGHTRSSIIGPSVVPGNSDEKIYRRWLKKSKGLNKDANALSRSLRYVVSFNDRTFAVLKAKRSISL